MPLFYQSQNSLIMEKSTNIRKQTEKDDFNQKQYLHAFMNLWFDEDTQLAHFFLPT